MALWTNRTVLSGASVAPNGTNQHTITFSPAQSGNFLVAIVSGSVTSTTPAGWTLLNSAINFTGLYVFTKTATAGESSFDTTHNGSNFALRGVVYEYSAGTFALGSDTALNSGSPITAPSLSGLTGTYTAIMARAHSLTTPGGTFGVSWTSPTTENYEDFVGQTAGAEGVGLSVAYQDNATSGTFTPNYAPTYSGTAASGGESVILALRVVTDVTPDPLAAYGFNETTGTTASDETTNNHDLTVNSASNFNIGREGYGLHQVGGGAPNRVSNAAAWFEVPERTIMFWGRRGSEGANTSSRSVYQRDGSDNITFGISISDGTNAAFTVRRGGTPITLTVPEVATGTWAHYALTYDQTTVRAFIDGVEVATQVSAGTIDSGDDNLYFYGEDYQQQVIDDLRLFDAALTEQQISTFMNDPIESPDVIAPSAPQNLSANVVNQSVTLDWDDSTDNLAVQNYIVYRSTTSGFTPQPGNQVGGPASSTYTESAPVGTWYYRVSARDEAGNESGPSSEVSATITSSPDYFFPSALGWDLGTTFIDDGNPGLNAGLTFAVTGASQIAGGRFYSPEAQTNLTVTLYENEIEVAQKTNMSVSTGWNFLAFDTPYLAQSGIDYCISIFLPAPAQSFTLVETADWAGASVGPMYTTLPGSGRFDLNSSERYPSSSSTRWFGVDAVVLGAVDPGFDPTFGATIADENAKEGALAQDYVISGVGDTDNLGFARQFSVNAGDTIDFSCDGDGTRIDIYRIGWYGGSGWRKVAELTNTATNQPNPTVIANSNGGVECTNWSTTAQWSVPADALSGLFVGIYRNSAQSNASYIPFVVRNDARTANVAYKTSDSTWALAYNYYGTPSSPLTGKSLYGAGGPLGSIGDRTHAVSYHRPIVTREGVPQTYWLACEAPMIRFLERNGIDIKYVASKDVDAGVSVINNTNVAVSSGHDEYWSDGMRDTFETYRDNGKHLLFFSGNEVFWRTRFDAQRNTMWCYKDTMSGPGGHSAGTPLDPVTWTGTWKDTRFPGRKPENTITGTDFRMNGVNDYAATFPSSFGSHAFWRDTSLSGGDITVNGIIGFEADEMLPTQPAGSHVTLTSHTFNIDGKRADDNGQEYAGNGDLNWGVVSQRYASGAVVVGFGTCQWSWGLDGVHDRGANYSNAAMQQATLNLFTDLGAAPSTTMSGLTTPAPIGSLDVYGAVPASSRPGKVKVWDGSAWTAHPMKVWDGSAWITHKAKGFDGSTFIEGKE